MSVEAVDIPRKHRWDIHAEKFLAPGPDGNQRNLRPCLLCGLWKVTVIPPHGLPWRQWVTKEGKMWQGEATPPCLDQPEAIEKTDKS